MRGEKAISIIRAVLLYFDYLQVKFGRFNKQEVDLYLFTLTRLQFDLSICVAEFSSHFDYKFSVDEEQVQQYFDHKLEENTKTSTEYTNILLNLGLTEISLNILKFREDLSERILIVSHVLFLNMLHNRRFYHLNWEKITEGFIEIWNS